LSFFAHGAQKALAWFDGPGFDGTVDMFSQMGIGEPLAVLAIAAEFLGGLGLIVGLLARIAALGVMTNMLVAIILVHRQVGFFMNWAGKQAGEGLNFICWQSPGCRRARERRGSFLYRSGCRGIFCPQPWRNGGVSPHGSPPREWSSLKAR
jgi:hypothetical protein